MFKSYGHLIPDSMRKDYPDVFQKLVNKLDELQAEAEAKASILQNSDKGLNPALNGVQSTRSQQEGAFYGSLNEQLEQIAEKLEVKSAGAIAEGVREAHLKQQEEDKRKREKSDELARNDQIKGHEEELIKVRQSEALQENRKLTKGEAIGELRAEGRIMPKDASHQEKVEAYGLCKYVNPDDVGKENASVEKLLESEIEREEEPALA